ncbi:MAG: UDP-glucose 4-epimerase GalE [bacterium]
MILIVGGAGYIGSHINKLLHQRGHETVVFDNLVYGHRSFAKWGEFVLGDLADREQIRLCFRRYPIEAVMHFSSFAYVGESVADPAKYYLNNVANTLNLLEAIRESNVKMFIFSSSCAVYGVPREVPIPEVHPRQPVNPYGRTKAMVEDILIDYDLAYGIKHINLRYFNAAGADPEGELGELHDPETHLIPLAIFAALGRREDIKMFGTDYPTEDGTCIRDYIHVSDLADAHILALEHLKKTLTSDSFNLGNGNGHSVREVVDTVKRVSGKDFRVTEARRREGDPPVLVGSSEKARDVLGWVPRYQDLRSIVETAWKWHSTCR